MFLPKAMSDAKSLDDWLCLSLIPGLGPVGARRLVEVFGSPAEVFSQKEQELAKVKGVRANQLKGFQKLGEIRELASSQLRQVESFGAELVPLTDERYPDLLKEIPDPPLLLYALGDVELMRRAAVAMVGSRSATTYGCRAAHTLARQLVSHEMVVISGLALGIDSEAHKGALSGCGKTIGVLGCGLDVVYPPQNRRLYEEIRSNGLLLSEYPLGTRPDGFRFPARNRIIAGMSQGVVVVEAARKSGSLITAQMALDFGREVFAVPGQIDSVKSEGAHWLLQQGAKLVAGAEDILVDLRPLATFSASGEVGAGAGHADHADLDPDAAALLQALEPYPLSRDEVCTRTGLSVARLSELFLYLELEGLIEMTPGDEVRRVTM